MHRLAATLCLAALAATGTANAKRVSITSEPTGASVVVDGRVIGKTPMETTKSALMPGWMNDGGITSAVISIELPMHVPQSVTISEFRVPKKIDVTLERDASAEQFENYLEQIPGLAAKTLATERSVLYTSDNLDADSRALEAQGYVMVGYVGSSSEVVPLDLVRDRAKQLGAAVVLLQAQFDGMQTEMRSVTTRQSGGVGTSFSSGSSYGSGLASFRASDLAGNSVHGNVSASGSSNFYDTSMSVTPGSTTTSVVPFAKRQYRTQATLWRKRAGNALGAIAEVLPSELRAKLQRNTGAYVLAIEDNSPAFYADVLVGDVITAIGGRPVRSPDELATTITALGPGVFDLEIVRETKPIALKVELR